MRLRTIIAGILASIILSVPVYAGSWEWVNDAWMYKGDSGSYLYNTWFTDPSSGGKYHFDTFGHMDTGLKYIGDKWYRFHDEKGFLVHNYYDTSAGLVSTSDGTVYRPDDSGFLIGQSTLYRDESNDAIFLIVGNCKNKPITFDGYVDVSGGGVSEKWYSYEENEEYMGNPVVIAPGDIKVILLFAPDAHALNFAKYITKIQAHYTMDGEPYYVWTEPRPYSKRDDYTLFFTHINE